MTDDLTEEMRKALLTAVRKKPGTFVEVFKRAWPVFRSRHTGGEDMARFKSYEILHEMSMRGVVDKEQRIYKLHERVDRDVSQKDEKDDGPGIPGFVSEGPEV